jgi:hypothetical protein
MKIKADLEELAVSILACQETACLYRKAFTETFYGSSKEPQWLYWWENEFLSPAAPRPKGISKYVPFRYSGNPRIMIIALRPSTEDFPSNADMLLAEALIENRLASPVFEVDRHAFVYYEGIFLTDVIKCRGLAGDKITNVPDCCKDYLRRELELVHPERIVAMGEQARGILWDIRTDIGFGSSFRTLEDIPSVWHYAYAFRMRKIREYKDRFTKAVTELSL